jgi:hypothetical protein
VTLHDIGDRQTIQQRHELDELVQVFAQHDANAIPSQEARHGVGAQRTPGAAGPMSEPRWQPAGDLVEVEDRASRIPAPACGMGRSLSHRDGTAGRDALEVLPDEGLAGGADLTGEDRERSIGAIVRPRRAQAGAPRNATVA